MTREMRNGRRISESDVRRIMAQAASEGIDLSTPDFNLTNDDTIVTVEHLPVQRFLAKLGFTTK